MNYRCNEVFEHSDTSRDAELALELRRFWHAIMQGANHPPSLEGLQRQQFWVLGALVQAPRRMSDLAECSQTSQASLTGIVDRLEERGLVHRTRSQEDRRVVQVELTAEGRATMKAANAEYFARVDALLGNLDDDEQRELLRLVRKITAKPATPTL